MDILFPILLTILLIFINACFVAAEFSLVKVRKTRLEELSSVGNRSADVALYCIDNIRRMLSATQLGITLASLSLGWVAESWFAKIIAPLLPAPWIDGNSFHHVLGAAVSLMLLTFIHVVLGELVPKNIALSDAERILLNLARPLKVFVDLTNPMIQLLSTTAGRCLRLLGYDTLKEHPFTEEELKIVMEDSREGGVLSDGEAEIINRAFVFADKKTKDVMIPLEKVQSITALNSFAENMNLIRTTGHTRFPYCKDNLQRILGIVHIKDLAKLTLLQNSNDDFVAMLRKPLYVNINLKQDELLKYMRRYRTHVAIVQDDERKNVGIVTLEDVLEELVGEFEEKNGVVI